MQGIAAFQPRVRLAVLVQVGRRLERARQHPHGSRTSFLIPSTTFVNMQGIAVLQPRVRSLYSSMKSADWNAPANIHTDQGPVSDTLHYHIRQSRAPIGTRLPTFTRIKEQFLIPYTILVHVGRRLERACQHSRIRDQFLIPYTILVHVGR
jgi:hypothetical protein